MRSVAFLGEIITTEHILDALRHFDSEYPDTNEYDSWLDRGNYKYAVRYRGKLYPCKYILSLASGFDRTDFGGGQQTNSVFRQLGFEVIKKRDTYPSPSSGPSPG